MFGCWGIRRKAIKTFCCLTNHEYCNFFDINMDAVSLYDREWMIFSTQVDREQRVLFLALGVSDTVGDEVVLNVVKCRLSHIYGLHGMRRQARQLLPSIPDQQTGLDNGYIQTVMSSVMHFLHTKQVAYLECML